MNKIYKLVFILLLSVGCLTVNPDAYAEDNIEDETSDNISFEETTDDIEENVEEIEEEIIIESETEEEILEEYQIEEVNEPVTYEMEYDPSDYNPTGFPFYNDDYLYAYEANEDSPVIELINEEQLQEIRKLIDDALGYKPISNNLLMKKISGESLKLTAEENHLDLVDVKTNGLSGEQSGYIFVVDEFAQVYVIKDSEGNGIPNAMVSITYLDEDGNEVERRIKTSDGNVKGVASFDNLKGTRYGLVDVQADGYHKATLLEDEITGGMTKTIILNKESTNEVYIRGIDFGGRDLINNDTTISLIKDNKDTLRFSILLTKTGNASLPDSVKLYDRNSKKLIYTFTNPVSYGSNSDTYLYSCEDNWMKQNGLLIDGYELYISYNKTDYDLRNVKVMDAIVEPDYVPDKPVELGPDELIGDFEDSSAIANAVKLGLAKWKVNVSIGTLPDGTFFIMASKSIDALSDSMSTLFEKSNSPKQAEKTSSIMDKLSSIVDDAFETAKKKHGVLVGKDSPFIGDKLFGTLSADVSLMIKGNYNEKRGKFEGGASIGFNTYTSAGMQCFIMAGPVPINLGFEFTFSSSTKISPSFIADEMFPLPKNIEFDGNKCKPFEMHASPGFKPFVCVGIRNAIGVEFSGSVGADLGVSIHVDDRDIKDLPLAHVTIDLSAALICNIYALMLSDTIVVLSMEHPRRIGDNWDKYKAENNVISIGQFKPIDLNECEEPIKNNLSEADGNKLKTYEVDVKQKNSPSGLQLLVENSYIDNQIQLVSTKNSTALFRIISKDGKARLVYQLQNIDTGEFENILHEVPMPEDKNVYEFALTSHKYGVHNIPDGNVYIAAVTGDIYSDDPEERAHSTSVVKMVVNIDENEISKSSTVTTSDENSYYFNAIPSYYFGDLIVAYKEAASFADRYNFTNYMVNVDGEKIEMSKNVPVYSTNKSSTESRASFWTVDKNNTNDDRLSLIGYNYMGNTEYNSNPHNFRISFDTKEFTSLYPGSDPFACIGTLNDSEYAIVAGKLYRFDYTSDAGSVVAAEVPEGRYSNVSFEGSNGHYQMLTNHETGTLFITSLQSVYESTDAVPVYIGDELNLAYVIEETDIYGTTDIVHGLRSYLIEDANAHNYTCAYNSHKMGLELAINKYHDESKTSNDVYVWEENAGYGFELTDFSMDSNVVTNVQKYVDATISYKNAGYGKGVLATIKVTDSEGNILTQADKNRSTGEYTDLGDIHTYRYDVLYPADELTMPIHFKTNPNWGVNKEEQIFVYLLNENNEVLSTVSLQMDEPVLRFNGNQEVLGGNHYAKFVIANESIIASESPSVVLIPDFADEEKNTVINPDNIFDGNQVIEQYSVGDDDLVSSKDNSKIKYNLNFSIEEIWERYPKDMLFGVKAYLVDSNGKVLNNNTVSFLNPYFKVKKEDSPSNNPSESPSLPAETDSPVNSKPINKNENINLTNRLKRSTISLSDLDMDKDLNISLDNSNGKLIKLLVDDIEVTIDDNLTEENDVKGYRLTYINNEGKIVNVGILSDKYDYILLSKEYINSLESGKHTAVFVYENGHREEITIIIPSISENEPQLEQLLPDTVNDSSKANYALYALISLLLFILILIAYIIYRKVNKNNN